jgi:hypothetical protein
MRTKLGKQQEVDMYAEMAEEYLESERNDIIDRATYRILTCLHRLQAARLHVERVAVAVCMGQHVRLGGGSALETCSPIYSLPALVVSHIVRLLTRDCKEIRLPILKQLSQNLHECVVLNEEAPINWGVEWGGVEWEGGERCLPTQKVALCFLSTALAMGLDENEDSGSVLSRMCSKIQSRACHLIYDMGRKTVRGGETMGSKGSRTVFWENMEETYGLVCLGKFPPCITLWTVYKSTQKVAEVVQKKRKQMLEMDQTLKRLTRQVQNSETTLEKGTDPNSGRALTDEARNALEKSLQSNAAEVDALQQRVGSLNKKLGECELLVQKSAPLRSLTLAPFRSLKMAAETLVQGPQNYKMTETCSDAMHVRQLLLRAQLSSAASDNQKMWAGYLCVCLSVLFFRVCVCAWH